jgi:hypothetical protein
MKTHMPGMWQADHHVVELDLRGLIFSIMGHALLECIQA